MYVLNEACQIALFPVAEEVEGNTFGDFLEVFLVEFKFSCTSLIILIAEYLQFFGQYWCTTVENTCSQVSRNQTRQTRKYFT